MSNLDTVHAIIEIQNRSSTSDVIIKRTDDTLTTSSFIPPEVSIFTGANIPIVSGYANILKDSIAKDNTTYLHRNNGRYGSEVIIGPDDRIRVSKTQSWPWCVHGHLIMHFPNNRTYIGSGTMVNKHHIITAGHCVYSKDDGGWANNVVFEAARNDDQRPFGSIKANRLISVKGWTETNSSEHDMGMVILDSDLGLRTGWFGIITGPDSTLLHYKVNLSGYPGDKGGFQLWTQADIIKSVSSERITYDIDTMGGQSGSGVWSLWEGHAGEKVCTIHTTGSTSGNGGTRISRWKFDKIVEWMSNY